MRQSERVTADPEGWGVHDAARSAFRFSFIIANYNYAAYVGAAIDSALAVDWPNVEVIVVDDGSTDASREVIGSYGDRVTALFRSNHGQRIANNAGFAQATGDIVVFLDADDMIEPGFARAVAQVWTSETSKVQVQMRVVDADNKALGHCLPPIRKQPQPWQIALWARNNNEYPSSPGSGNAYARSFLEKLFPLGDEHDSSTDSTCLALAPLLGNVTTVLEPLVRYRRHGDNDSNLFRTRFGFSREVARALQRQRSQEIVCARLGLQPPSAASLRRSLHVLQLRAASLRWSPDHHPIPGDGIAQAIHDALAAPFKRSHAPLIKRLAIMGWTLAVLLSPRMLVYPLLVSRFRSGQ